MDHPITFTPQDLITLILGICGAITCVSGAIAVIVKAVTAVKQPNKTQDQRLDSIEKRLDANDKLFEKDNRRIGTIEEGNRVTQRALLALLSHAINGNNTAELKKAEADLSEYLIRR